MARSSQWTRLIALEKRLPGSRGDEITGVLQSYIDPVEGRICGMTYEACDGYSHELDGKSIEFEPPIDRVEVPSPWRELLAK